MKDILLYGKRKGDKYEDLIAQCPSVEYAERLKTIARERWGFIEFRIAVIDMTTPPDFAGTVNI